MTIKNISSINFEKQGGIVPVVIQHAKTKQVLMLGFMNREALEKTIKDKKVTFWSRTKNRLWQKGEKSKNYLNVIEIQKDCDADTLLIFADPQGPTCHKGRQSCFESNIGVGFFEELYRVVEDRKNSNTSNSYSARLFLSGIDKICQKVGEEAVETVIASKNKDKHSVIEESADLMYHLIVLWAFKKIPIESIIEELIRRNIKK